MSRLNFRTVGPVLLTMDTPTAVDLVDSAKKMTPERPTTDLEVSSWRRFGTIGYEAYLKWVLNPHSTPMPKV